MSSAPRVSVVTATYNRSNVLRYAVESVLHQTLTDWELIVVGDACTDDTAEVMASFQDPRIHFLNLEHNVGEQSGPNNVGTRRARGSYVAYLNHDDLWLPRHLELGVSALDRLGADLVFTLSCVVRREGPNALGCATPTGDYEPYLTIPASCWVFRRELVDAVGPWRSHRECHRFPSGDWLMRARWAGKRLRLVPRLTVVTIPSGNRAGSYAVRESAEQLKYLERLVHDPEFLERALTDIALGHAVRDFSTGANLWVWPYGLRAVKNSVRLMLSALGIDPLAARRFVRYFRRGVALDRLRKVRGLLPLERRGRVL